MQPLKGVSMIPVINCYHLSNWNISCYTIKEKLLIHKVCCRKEYLPHLHKRDIIFINIFCKSFNIKEVGLGFIRLRKKERREKFSPSETSRHSHRTGVDLPRKIPRVSGRSLRDWVGQEKGFLFPETFPWVRRNNEDVWSWLLHSRTTLKTRRGEVRTKLLIEDAMSSEWEDFRKDGVLNGPVSGTRYISSREGLYV